MLETQSPTLMIQIVLGVLLPRERLLKCVVLSRRSSTSGKEDMEDGRAVSVVQVVESPVGQTKILFVKLQNQNPTVIKERGLRNCKRFDAAPGAGEEVQIIPPLVSSHRSPTL